MKIVVLRETQEGEARVALMPESVKKLIALGTLGPGREPRRTQRRTHR